MDQGPLSERVVPICSNGFLSLVHPYSLVIAHKAVSAISGLILYLCLVSGISSISFCKKKKKKKLPLPQAFSLPSAEISNCDNQNGISRASSPAVYNLCSCVQQL